MKIEDFIALLAKLDFEPRRREKLRRNVPTWAFGFEHISPVSQVAFSIELPRYPARWDGCQNWDGTAVPVNLDPDLVMLLDFEEGSGSTAYDRIVKNRNNGELYNALWTTGKIGFALEFTGESYVTIPAPVGSPLELPEEFTIELWIKGEPRGDYLKIVNKGDGFSNNYLFLGDPWNKVGFLVRDEADTTHVGASFGEVLDNEWHHLAGTFTTTELKAYTDGVLQETTTTGWKALTAAGKPVELADLWNVRYRGIIDEVRIYRRALSAEEIANHAACNYFNAIGVWG